MPDSETRAGLPTAGTASASFFVKMIDPYEAGRERIQMFERWTDRARKVAELSLREALQLGHSYIGTEHLLLGLIREGEGMAAQVLVNDLGVDLGAARKAVIRRMSSPPAKPAVCRHCGEEVEEWTFSDHCQNPGPGWRHVGNGSRQCQVIAEPA